MGTIVSDRFDCMVGNKQISTDEWIFPLVLLDENDHPVEFIQTCFSFANIPVVLTAGHFNDLFGHLKPDFETDKIKLPHKKASDFVNNIGVLRVNTDRSQFMVHKVFFATFGSEHDLAVLVTDDNFAPTPTIPILASVAIGSEIVSMGFPKWQESFDKISELQIKNPKLSCSQGNITELHTEKHAMSWFPTIEFNAEMQGGMSGGPVMMKNDTAIFGVNSTSFDGPTGPSYATWLGLALNLNFGLNAKILYEDNTEIDLRSFTLLDIIKFTTGKEGLNHKIIPIKQ